MALTPPGRAPRREGSGAELAVPAPSAPGPLPIRSSELMDGLAPGRALALEREHGNTALIRALDILGIAGPFRAVNPWEIEDERGRRLIHAGGYAALPFGERYPPLVEFVRDFLERDRTLSLPQQSAAEWRAALETNLVHLLAREAPSHADSRAFFSNSGAEAIEAALKFARAARPGGGAVIAFERGYHGKTAGALSITPNESYQALFRPLLPGVEILPYGDARAFEKALYRIGPPKVCAVVVEPVQGEGGVVTPPEGFLARIGELAREHGIIVIADEIQTGLGRTGHLFASLAGGLEPDIVTLAKPLGGGLVPVGATLARRRIVHAALHGIEGKRHSTTFGGNALAMAVGLRSLEILIDEGLVEKARRDGERGLERLRAIRDRYPGYVAEVRGAGMLFALRLRHVVRPALVPGQEELVRQLGTGLALRALHLGGVHVCFTQNAGQIVRLTPPLNQPPELMEQMFDRVEAVARSHRNAWTMLPRTPVTRLARLARLALEG